MITLLKAPKPVIEVLEKAEGNGKTVTLSRYTIPAHKTETGDVRTAKYYVMEVKYAEQPRDRNIDFKERRATYHDGMDAYRCWRHVTK